MRGRDVSELFEPPRPKASASINKLTRAGVSLAMMLAAAACSLPPLPPLPGQPPASPEPPRPAAAAKPSQTAALESSCPPVATSHDFTRPFDFRRTGGEQLRGEDALLKDYEGLSYLLRHYFSEANDPWFWKELEGANGGTYEDIRRIFASKIATDPLGAGAQRETITSYLVLRRPEDTSRVLIQRNRFRTPQVNAPDSIVDIVGLYFTADGKFACGGSLSRLLSPSETADLAARVTGLGPDQLRQDEGASGAPGVSYDTREAGNRVSLRIKSDRTAELRIQSP